MNQAMHLDVIPIGAGRSRQLSPPLSTPWRRVPVRREHWLWTALSIAAVIAIVLGGIWHYSGSDDGGKGSDRPALSGSPIPAPRTAGFVATPTAMGLLLSTVFPADAVANRPASAIFYRATIAPGGHATYDVPAAVIDHVVAGTYQIVSGCSVMLYRAGGPDQFAWTKPGVKYILQPGDSIVYPGGPSYCGKETVSNAGSTPLVFLGTQVTPDNFTPSANPNATPDDIVGLTAETLDTIPSWQLSSIPAGPMAVTIERMTSAKVNASTPTDPQVKRLVAQEPSGSHLVITFRPSSIPAATPSA